MTSNHSPHSPHSPHVLECRLCGAPVRFQVNFCAYCRAPLSWEQPLPLERAELVFSETYPQSPLLGSTILKATKLEKTSGGIIAHIPPAGFAWAHSTMKMQNVCACVEAIALDREASFGVLVRAHAEGKIVSGYVASVAPGFRSFRLTRNIEGSKLSTASVLEDWQSTPVVAPVGGVNHIELRCADMMLQVLVNGVRVLSVLDAGLGFGGFGWRATSLGPAARVLFRSINAFAV